MKSVFLYKMCTFLPVTIRKTVELKHMAMKHLKNISIFLKNDNHHYNQVFPRCQICWQYLSCPKAKNELSLVPLTLTIQINLFVLIYSLPCNSVTYALYSVSNFFRVSLVYLWCNPHDHVLPPFSLSAQKSYFFCLALGHPALYQTNHSDMSSHCVKKYSSTIYAYTHILK